MNQAQIGELREMVKKKPSLIWYTNSYDELNEQAIVEAVYHFGSWDDIDKFHKIVGLREAKELFHTLIQKPRSNLKPIVQNYFTLYYDRHAS